MEITYKKVWFFGGDKKDENADDWVQKYVASNGVEIECGYGFTNWNMRWYDVHIGNDSECFNTLKEAKQYVESHNDF